MLIRTAVRSLARRPGLSITIFLTLALGIGANSAIFSAVDAILLKPLPYPDADRLVAVYELNLSQRGATQLVAPGRVLTSVLKRLDNVVYDTVKRVKEGRFQPGRQVYDLKAGGVGLSEMKYTKQDIPASVLARLDKLPAEFNACTSNVPVPVSVPESTPVFTSSVSPAGSVPPTTENVGAGAPDATNVYE